MFAHPRQYLFVDDNRAFAENLGEILEDAGAIVTLAANGAEALTIIREGHFDALVTDMHMPGLNGAELVHEARKVDARLPAIVVTAYSSDAELSAAHREGLLAILPKPVPLETLLRLLSEASHAFSAPPARSRAMRDAR